VYFFSEQSNNLRFRSDWWY